MPDLIRTPDGRLHTLFSSDHLVELIREYMGCEVACMVRRIDKRADTNARDFNTLLDDLDKLEAIVLQLADEPEPEEQRRLAQKAGVIFGKERGEPCF